MLSQLNESQAHEWCFGKRKALLSILLQESFELPFLIESR